jgi:Cu(I)/Ag(I) efflux system membrane fusion protein
VNGLGTVWVNVDVPEAAAAAVRPGAPISATVPGYPGERFAGQVSAVLPEVTAATRTVRARVELPNPAAKLKPGMYATVSITPREAREAVLVPSESVIMTGRRNVVLTDLGNGRYQPVEVEVGREEGGRTEILKGIEAGAKVISSGQFLIDSEASLRGAERRMGAPTDSKLAPAQAGAQFHHAEGKLERIGPRDLTISHGPVPSLKWGPMTMDFSAPKDGLPADLKPGDAIAFEFVQSPQGSFDVTKIQRKPGSIK